MADEGDIAAEYQERHNAEALAMALVLAQRERGTSATHCVDCDDEIPQKRRETLPGVERCTECQRDFEKQRRGFNGGLPGA